MHLRSLTVRSHACQRITLCDKVTSQRKKRVCPGSALLKGPGDRSPEEVVEEVVGWEQGDGSTPRDADNTGNPNNGLLRTRPSLLSRQLPFPSLLSDSTFWLYSVRAGGSSYYLSDFTTSWGPDYKV